MIYRRFNFGRVSDVDMEHYDHGEPARHALGMLLSFLLLATVAFFWLVRGEAGHAGRLAAPDP